MTGHHTCISNRLSLMKCYRKLQSKQTCAVCKKGQGFQDNFSVSDDAKKLRLWKLRPWLQKLQEHFLCIPPEECHLCRHFISSLVQRLKERNLLHWMNRVKHCDMMDEKELALTQVSRPAIAETYNKLMGGVDFLDMLSAL